MGLKSWLFGDFIDYIEWKDNNKSELLYKFPLNNKEISYNAKLKVNEGEIAIFIKNHSFDALTYGEYLLNSQTLPNIAKELGWDEHYDEPFSLDIFFINKDSFRFKWGNKEPILLNDKDNSIARLEASGYFSLHIINIELFLKYFEDKLSNSNIDDLMNSLFEDNFIDVLINRKSSIYSLGADSKEFSQFLYSQMVLIFNKYGIRLDNVETLELNVEQELPYYTGKNANNQKSYYIIKNSKPIGPFSEDEIKDMIKNETLIPASYIWRDGLKEWVKVKDIFDFENL